MTVFRSIGQLSHISQQQYSNEVCKLFWTCPVKFIQSRLTFKTIPFLRRSKKFSTDLIDTVGQNETIFTPYHDAHRSVQEYLSENTDTSIIFQGLALQGHVIVDLRQTRRRFVPFVVTESYPLTFSTFRLTIPIALSFKQNLLDPVLLSRLCNYLGYVAPQNLYTFINRMVVFNDYLVFIHQNFYPTT